VESQVIFFLILPSAIFLLLLPELHHYVTTATHSVCTSLSLVTVQPRLDYQLRLSFYTIVLAIPVTGRGGLYGCLMLRIPHCLDDQLRDDGKVVSPTYRPRSSPQKIILRIWYSFLLEAE
jgi:hypothetical protein